LLEHVLGEHDINAHYLNIIVNFRNGYFFTNMTKTHLYFVLQKNIFLPKKYPQF